MAILNFYFASCVLLLTLSWRTSTGFPVRTARCATGINDCSLLFKNLLLNITELLNNNDLCYGITSNKVVLRSKAETVLACTPTLTQNSGCMVQRNSPFSESECLTNIRKDLAHYAAAFRSYRNSSLRSPEKEVPLLTATLEIIQRLRENCALMQGAENDSSEEDIAQIWSNDTFSNRQEMCNMIRGFHIRAITINRAMGYISSGDHQK